MKLVPGPLPPIPTGATTMDRLPLMPFSPDLLWRYSLNFPSMGQPPSSPLLDYKSSLPNSLASDPRIWTRDDVSLFLRWAEREFDIQPIDMDRFQMNGKAMCLLTRADLGERAPGSGDVLYNVLQILVREANNLQRLLPSSPVTPTSRHPYPLSPHSHPPTPNWNALAPSESFHNSHPATLAAQLLAHSNSVTLSPAPSVESQNSSPQHTEINHTFNHSIFNANGSNGSGSNPSDSDEDDKKWNQTSPPNTPSYLLNHQMNLGPPRSPKENVSSPGPYKCFGREFFPSDWKSPKENLSSPGPYKSFGREFFPSDSTEPNTNGRLLWDFLQQLLNDPQQRYTNHIAWKNQETGVFKIVDPAGLAKLWGIQKNHLSMNYDKMSRALRYYYRVNILRKVQGERHCYQFLRNPTELKNIKNISLLRQQMSMSPTNTKPATTAQTAPQIVPQLNFKHEAQTSSKHEPQSTIKQENEQIHNGNVERIEYEYEDKPTDLSMEGPTDLSSNSSRQAQPQVSIVCSPDPPPTVHPQNYH